MTVIVKVNGEPERLCHEKVTGSHVVKLPTALNWTGIDGVEEGEDDDEDEVGEGFTIVLEVGG